MLGNPILFGMKVEYMRVTNRTRYYAVKSTAIDKLINGDSAKVVLKYIDNHVMYPEQRMMIFAVAASAGFGKQGSREAIQKELGIEPSKIASLIYDSKQAHAMNMDRFNMFIELCPVALKNYKVQDLRNLITFISKCNPSDYSQDEITEYSTFTMKGLRQALLNHYTSVTVRCTLCDEEVKLTKIRFGEVRCFDCVSSYRLGKRGVTKETAEKHQQSIEKRNIVKERSVELQKKVEQAVGELKGELKPDIVNLQEIELNSIFTSFHNRLFSMLGDKQSNISRADILARIDKISKEIGESYK